MSLVPCNLTPEDEERIITELLGTPKQKPEAREVKAAAQAAPLPKIVRVGDDFVLSNLHLYGLDGTIVRTYDKVRIYNHTPSVHGKWELNQDEWTEFFVYHTKSRLPSLPLLYSIMEAIYDNPTNPIFQDLRRCLKSKISLDPLILSTRIDYKNCMIWHDFGAPEQIGINCYVPGTNKPLEKLVENGVFGDQEWSTPLRALFMPRNINEIPHVFKVINPDSPRIKCPKYFRSGQRVAVIPFYPCTLFDDMFTNNRIHAFCNYKSNFRGAALAVEPTIV